MNTAWVSKKFVCRLETLGSSQRSDNSRTATTDDTGATKDDRGANIISRLLNLPGEIREKIWLEALRSSTGYVRPIWGELVEGRNTHRTFAFHFYAVNNDRLYSRKERIHLSLFATAREIYHECANLFWKANIFVLEPSNPHHFPRSPETPWNKNWLSQSFYRKIEHLQLDFNIVSILQSYDECWKTFEALEATLDVIAEMTRSEPQSLKSLTMKPLSSGLNYSSLELFLDAITYRPGTVEDIDEFAEIFEPYQEVLILAGVKRKIEGDFGWADKTADEQRAFLQEYPEPIVTAALVSLTFMGGPNFEMWVDGNLSLKVTEYEVEIHEGLLPLKESEE